MIKYDQEFTLYDQEFTFCPTCGEAINWMLLWEKVGLIKRCEQCNWVASFERRDPEQQPPEGDICIECGQWVCVECINWGESGDTGAICKKCGETPVGASDLYDECPDCGDPIADSVKIGDACKNCTHVFNDVVADYDEIGLIDGSLTPEN